ncbi:MAG TPA: hypothetical protein ENI07_14305 [Desulfobacterales bacterium]|nr:hypothetical protein [Desulfobacterales bacterium]
MLFNEDKIILDLCGGTGAWSKPYADAGYDVRVITLPEQEVTDYIPPKNVYGVLAAPPCTEFSLALNGCPERPRDFIAGMVPVNACIRIIHSAGSVFWALENPVGLLSRWLGAPCYKFDPWMFGDPYTKKTALWGNFKKPVKKFNKKTAVMTEDQILRCKENRKPQDSGTGEEKSIKRSITSPKFARAFFEANP